MTRGSKSQGLGITLCGFVLLAGVNVRVLSHKAPNKKNPEAGFGLRADVVYRFFAELNPEAACLQ